MKPSKQKDYQKLIDQIEAIYQKGSKNAVIAVNRHLVETYWKIGQYIVEYEQGGKHRAIYGQGLLKQLNKDLVIVLGKGFSLSNLKRMRQFYLEYPKGATVSHLLSWSHFVELLKIEDSLERNFYEKQTINEKWSIRELQRQKKASLFLRLAASTDKEGILNIHLLFSKYLFL